MRNRRSKRQRSGTQPTRSPQFDITSLPSLNSITAATDVRAFLAPGVPAELTRAALRRAWTADPAIRDFKGLAENDWDFTDPKAMAGFTTFLRITTFKKLVAQIFGEKDKAADPTAAAEPDRRRHSRCNRPSNRGKSLRRTMLSRRRSMAEPLPNLRRRKQVAADREVDLVHRNSNTAIAQ